MKAPAMPLLPALLAVLLAAAVAVAQDAPPAAPTAARLLALRTQCMAEVKATEDDVKELQVEHQVTKDVTKKLTLCLFKATKIMDDKNKLSKTGALEAADKALDGRPDKAEKMKVATEIVELCEKEVNPQQVAPEETAKLVYDCLKKNIVEKKLHEQWKV